MVKIYFNLLIFMFLIPLISAIGFSDMFQYDDELKYSPKNIDIQLEDLYSLDFQKKDDIFSEEACCSNGEILIKLESDYINKIDEVKKHIDEKELIRGEYSIVPLTFSSFSYQIEPNLDLSKWHVLIYSFSYYDSNFLLNELVSLDSIDYAEYNSKNTKGDLENDESNIKIPEKNIGSTDLLKKLDYPIDPFFEEQWAFENTGQFGGVVGADIDWLEAWQFEQGSEDVIVAVIGSGVDYTHYDLKNKMWFNEQETLGNKNDDCGNGFVDDYYGYDFCASEGCLTQDNDPMDEFGEGTHLAGVVGAETNNIIPDFTPQGAGRLFGFSKIIPADFEGISKVPNQEDLVLFTSSEDSGLYIVEIGSDQYDFYDVAPTLNPRGITNVEGNYWISDAEENLIYEMQRDIPNVLLNKIRISVLESHFQDIPGSPYYALNINEIELYKDDEEINYASYAVASSNRDPYSTYYDISYINDGDLSSSYRVFNGDPVYITLDFSTPVEVDKIVINSGWGRPTDYMIDYFDGSDWHTLVEVDNNTHAIRYHELSSSVVSISDSFSSPGSDPRGLDWDGQNLWNVDGVTKTIYKLDLNGNILDSIYVGDLDNEPWGIAISEEGIWFSGDEKKKTYKLNSVNGELDNYFDSAFFRSLSSYQNKVSQNRGLLWISDDLFIDVDNGHYDPNQVEGNSFYAKINSTPISDTVVGVGVAGTCPNCKLMAVKALDSEGRGTIYSVGSSISYAALNGADIILVDANFPQPSVFLEDVIDYAVSQGAIIVAGVGDQNSDLIKTYPAAYENVVSVGATNYFDSRNTISGGSNYGNVNDKWIDIGAPGSNIKSTYCCQGFDYYDLSGTKVAAAIVAGSMGLVKSYYPEWSRESIIAQILSTAEDLNLDSSDYLDSYSIFGSGRINVNNALTSNLGHNVVYKSYEIDDSFEGNGDGYLSPGETIRLFVDLRNDWSDVNDVNAILTTQEEGITIYKNNAEYGNLQTLERKTSWFSFNLDDSLTPGEVIDFNLEINIEGTTFHKNIPLKVKIVEEYLPGWPKFSNSDEYFLSSSLSVVDLNGDSQKEIVFLTQDSSLGQTDSSYIYAFNSNGLLLPGWPKLHGLGYGAPAPVFGDVSHDGKNEIIYLQKINSNNFKINVKDMYGSDILGWPFEYLSDTFSFGDSAKLSVLDVNNDGNLNIFLFISSNDWDKGFIFAWDSYGNLMEGYNPKILNTYAFNPKTSSFADLNNDGNFEIITLSGQDLYIYDYLGQDFFNFENSPLNPIYLSDLYGMHGYGNDLPIADLNNDGIYTILFSSEGHLQSYNLENEPILYPDWTHDCPSIYWEDCYYAFPLFADINGDGFLERIFHLDYYIINEEWSYTQYSELHVYNADGSVYGDGCWPIIREGDSNLFSPYSQLVLGDITGDGKLEIVIQGERFGGKIYAFDESCNEVYNFPLTRERSGGNLVLSDIDSNGDLDLVDVSSDSLYIYDLNNPLNSNVNGWHMPSHDLQRTSNPHFSVEFPLLCDNEVSYGFCSIHQPLFCDEGQIVNNCQACGCPLSTPVCKSDGSCVKSGKTLQDRFAILFS